METILTMDELSEVSGGRARPVYAPGPYVENIYFFELPHPRADLYQDDHSLDGRLT
jgi:hypothetical protein